MNLTTTAITAAEPGTVLRDDLVPGLHVRVFPARRSYYLFYRTKHGVQRRPKLGDHGVITLAQAREIAREMLAEVAAGRDPVAARQTAREAPTFAELWPVFVAKHLKNPKRPRKPRTIRDYDYIYERHFKDRFGGRILAEITRDTVERLHDGMRDSPVHANRTLAALSTFFRWAIREKRAAFNPCVGVTHYEEEKRERFMVEDEARAIAAKLVEYAAAHPQSVAFIYLLILTGARPDEVARFEWTMLRGDMIVMSEHKTDRTGDRRIVFLPQAAQDVIARLPRSGQTIVGIQSPRVLWERIRKEIGSPDLRLYDLRHTFASAALAAGYSLDQVGLLLGHKSPITTRRYAHLAEKLGREVAAGAANILTGQMQPLSLPRNALPVPHGADAE